MSFAAKEKKNVQNQDKQTPHTVLQKISPKPTRTPLTPKRWVLPQPCIKYHLQHSFPATGTLSVKWNLQVSENASG